MLFRGTRPGPAAAPEDGLAVVSVPHPGKNVVIQHAVHDHHTALCGSLWQLSGMGVPHWVFSLKSHVLEGNFFILGRNGRRQLRA